jgi:hypothetical protein
LELTVLLSFLLNWHQALAIREFHHNVSGEGTVFFVGPTQGLIIAHHHGSGEELQMRATKVTSCCLVVQINFL